MDYRRENGFSGGNVVQILSGNQRNNGDNENWEAEWATEDDYGMFNFGPYTDTNSSYEFQPSQSQSGSEPRYKRSRNSQSSDIMASDRSKAIGKMFYKTKLCCKFRAGTCPYITNCNFAHSIEELRKPPPNWQEIMESQDEDREAPSEAREEYQIPILGVSDERSYKGRHCKKFYTEEGCPYGENCTFLHDEQSRVRESVTISLGSGNGGGGGGGGGGDGGGGAGHGNNGNQSVVKPSNWKTRICNKWELTGYCPFGGKCHFAHGTAELHQYGGGPLDSEMKDSSTPVAKSLPLKTSGDQIAGSHASLPRTDGYHIGSQLQRLSSNMATKAGPRPMQKWKGPDKISKIYGDWIDDL